LAAVNLGRSIPLRFCLSSRRSMRRLRLASSARILGFTRNPPRPRVDGSVSHPLIPWETSKDFEFFDKIYPANPLGYASLGSRAMETNPYEPPKYTDRPRPHGRSFWKRFCLASLCTAGFLVVPVGVIASW